MKRSYIKTKQVKDKSDKKQLEHALDKLVFEILQLRDRQCVQCDSQENLTTGHVFSRRVAATCWDLENNYLQCLFCNSAHENNRQPYFKWVIDHIGQGRFDALKQKWDRPEKLYSPDLEEMKKKLEEMKEIKNPKYWCSLTYPKCEFLHGRCVYCGEIEHLVEKETEARYTALMSENVLARDWLNSEEDEAWKDL